MTFEFGIHWVDQKVLGYNLGRMFTFSVFFFFEPCEMYVNT